MDTITPEFAAGLVARSVRLLPVIRANAETFARAVALHLGSRRMGDQIGALLAGAYSLHSERPVTEAEAEEYVKREEWQSLTSEGNAERDEFRLLTTLVEARVRVTQGREKMEATMGRLIMAMWEHDDAIPVEIAEQELFANGIRVEGDRPNRFRADKARRLPPAEGTPDGVWVSSNYPALKKILAGTPWAAGWMGALGRLPGAIPQSKKVVRFGPTHISKPVWLPRAVIEGNS